MTWLKCIRKCDCFFCQIQREVIVDLACGMAVLRGADVFVLGIMGAPSGRTLQHADAVHYMW